MLRSNGNVGVGTAFPTAKLEVQQVLINGVSGRNHFKDIEKNDGIGLRVGTAWGKYGIYAENGPVVIGGLGGTKLQDEHVTITTDGRVMLAAGAAIPPGKLMVGGRTDIHQGPTPIFNGLKAENSDNGRAELVLSSAYSDLVVASSFQNDWHGSTLTFAAINPVNPGEYRKFVINQGNWGARKQMLSFGYNDINGAENPHVAINPGTNIMVLDGLNKRLGIGTDNPNTTLHVAGEISTDSPYMSKTRNHFKVDGSINKWYPVVIEDLDWYSGNLEIELTRASIHLDSTLRGSMVAKFTAHSTNWGHESAYWEAKVRQSPGKRFVNGISNVYHAPRIVIWLKGGGTTYHWTSNHKMRILDYFALDVKYSYGTGGANSEQVNSKTVISPEYNEDSLHLDSHGLVGQMRRGMIVIWTGSLSPTGWAFCDGTNGTPDLRGRFVLGAGQGAGLTNRISNQTGGAESVALSTGQLPAHNHSLNDPGHFHTWTASRQQAGTDDNNNTREFSRGDRGASDTVSKNTDTKPTGISINNTGSNQGHENMPPFYILAYIMKL
ncbi:MAG TPA: hypothetical protein ENJ82_11920 [Bacteroidetes bacterium]|nr:hypothetical protein [Bacteroidota bacterium]